MKRSPAKTSLLDGRARTALLLFVVVLVVMFYGVFLPNHTLFSNDGPLGELMAQCHRLPGRFTGCWQDLNSVGFNGGAASPNLSMGLQWLLGPVWFSKSYAMVSLLVLGFGAWCFFRQSGLTPLACLLGGLAAMLNSTLFSVACWGVGAHAITAGMFFLALAALADTSPCRRWLRLVLAGLAVGMGVAEGADVGAIFSLYVVAFMVYQAWIAEGSRGVNLAKGLGRLAVVTLCAVFLAAEPVYALVTTAIKGVTVPENNPQSASQRWDWATQWSLPKRELLGLVVPGLFGYRMDSPDGKAYWGIMGRDPAWEKYFEDGGQGPPPKGLLRFSGGGNYAGVLVVLLAVWVAAQSFRPRNSVFNLAQRKWLWFWLGVAVISLLLALGRFAPVYRLVYALPYFSTIRNPVKFLDLYVVALVTLFAFGIDAIQRKYLAPPDSSPAPRWAGFTSWWGQADSFDRYWVLCSGVAWVTALGVWLLYAGQLDVLEQYLQWAQVGGDVDAIARFSIHQVGWFVFVFILAASLIILIFSGAFAGRRVGGLLLGLLLVADLGLANQPWIVYWNYHNKYASNPIIDLLRDKPYEHRVAITPLNMSPRLMVLPRLYRTEWLQHQFPFYNIQSFDVVEMPRIQNDFLAFVDAADRAGGTKPLRAWSRAWQLTNTRYLLAAADFEAYWNGQASLAHNPLQRVARFDIVPKPGISEVTEADQLTATPTADGHFALFEFTDALPRAKLYDHWQVNTNDAAVLEQLFSPAFHPQSSVFVAGGIPASSATVGTNQTAGSVHYVSYAPKDIVLQANAASPSVLLLNDHYDPNWKVSVDGKPGKLLRCNFLMRGVYLLPGAHRVEFKFQPPVGLLYVSLAAVATGLLALGLLLVSVTKGRLAVSKTAAPLSQDKSNRKWDSLNTASRGLLVTTSIVESRSADSPNTRAAGPEP